jgi:hypothetical protein
MSYKHVVGRFYIDYRLRNMAMGHPQANTSNCFSILSTTESNCSTLMDRSVASPIWDLESVIWFVDALQQYTSSWAGI